MARNLPEIECADLDAYDAPEPCEPTPEDDEHARREFRAIIDRETRVVEALVTERVSPHSRVRA